MSDKQNTELGKKSTTPAQKNTKTDVAKKAKTAANKSKSGGRISRYIREMKSELKKVVWPTKKQTINNTGVVIACVIVVGIIIWLFDTVASQFIAALLSLFGK